MLTETAIQQGKAVALFGEEPVARGNHTMIFRAIRNLAENAIRHTPAGTTVELEVRPNGSVSVSDYGPGVRDQDRGFIFRRFWRGDRNSGEGTGLGLAIVSRAEILSGEIAVSNRSEGGRRRSSLVSAELLAQASPVRPPSAGWHVSWPKGAAAAGPPQPGQFSSVAGDNDNHHDRYP